MKRIPQHKLLLILAGLAMIWVTLAFLWGELNNLSVYKKIDHQKVTNFFVAIAALAGCFAAWAAYNTMRQKGTTEKALHLPRIVPQALCFAPELLGELGNDNQNSSLRVMLRLKNIGIGWAENIVVQWFYNPEVLTRNPNSISSGINLITNVQHFIAAIDRDKTGTCPLPWPYLALFSEENGIRTNSLYDFPAPLFLEITCTDVLGHRYGGKHFVGVSLQDKIYITFS